VDQRQAIAGVFDRAASTYDQVGVDMFQPIAERLVQELAPQPGERALDAGCGRGAVLVRLAQAVGPSGSVAGIDLSPRMVDAAREAAAAVGCAADVRIGDAQHPDWPLQSFGLIASSLVLFFLADPLEGLRRWRDLLVDGGRVGISTFGDYSAPWKAVDAVFEPYLPPPMRDARTSGAAGPFTSDRGVEQLFEDAGFTGVRTTTMNLDVRFRDEEHWYEWSWSVGQRAMWERVPDDQREAVRAEAFRRLDDCRDGAGRVGFEQVVRFTLGRR
jgi:ubiquinone/menaquinone biosynthesis C-methylase UbiE